MEPSIAELFLLCDTALELWQALKDMYGQENNYSRIYQLKLEIRQEKQGTRKHVEYLGALQKKRDELRLYRPTTTDLAVIKKREEEDDVFEYLAGLNPSYEAVRAQIMNTVPLPSYSQIKNMIQQEEGRREAMSCLQPIIEEGHEAHGFAATKSSNFPKTGQNPRSQIGSNGSEIKRCTGCKKEGHTHESCWFLHLHLKPKHWKNRGEGGAADRGRERKEGSAGRVFHAEKRDFEQPPSNGSVSALGSGFNPSAPKLNALFSSGSSGSGAQSGSEATDQLQSLIQQMSVLLNQNQSKFSGISSTKKILIY